MTEIPEGPKSRDGGQICSVFGKDGETIPVRLRDNPAMQPMRHKDVYVDWTKLRIILKKKQLSVTHDWLTGSSLIVFINM